MKPSQRSGFKTLGIKKAVSRQPFIWPPGSLVHWNQEGSIFTTNTTLYLTSMVIFLGRGTRAGLRTRTRTRVRFRSRTLLSLLKLTGMLLGFLTTFLGLSSSPPRSPSLMFGRFHLWVSFCNHVRFLWNRETVGSRNNSGRQGHHKRSWNQVTFKAGWSLAIPPKDKYLPIKAPQPVLLQHL